MRSPFLAGPFAILCPSPHVEGTEFRATPLTPTVYIRKGQGMLEQVFTKR